MAKLSKLVEATGKDVDGAVELIIVSGEFEGCKFHYGKIEFDEGENEDGSKNMHLEYEITNDFKIDLEKKEQFLKFIGDCLVEILTEHIETNQVVFHGGT